MSWTLTMKLDSFAGSGQVSPEEIKSTEMELGLRVGLLSLQLFPSGGATDFVFVTVLHSSWDSNCVVRWSTAALVFRVGGCFEVSLFCPPFPTRPRP